MSVKSMTGYGRATESFDNRDISVDIKSVNHRYFDFSTRISKDYSFLEDKIKSTVNKYVSRGKIDLYLFVDNAKDCGYEIEINEDLARGYNNAFKSLSKTLKIKNDISASIVAKLPDMIKLKKKEVDEQELEEQVIKTVVSALESYNQMRTIEGEKLANYINENLDLILSTVDKIEILAPESIEKYKERLTAKLVEVLQNDSVDQQRIVTEAAIFADKIDVGEETVRLRSHISQFKELILKTDGAVGKKLDFIIQEMNREINTIGSKCNSLEITRLVVDTKSVIEKIREQIQNIE